MPRPDTLHPAPAGLLADRIECVLDELRPRLRMDGAELSVVSLDSGVLRLHMSGRTSACPVALALLQTCLERKVRDRVPEVTHVQIERFSG